MKANSILLKSAAGIVFGAVLLGSLFADATSSLLFRSASAAKTDDDDHGQTHKIGAASYDEGYVISQQQGQITCRNATPEEAMAMAQRDPDEQLQVITPVISDLEQQTGLKITLRGTAQLDGFPAAREAFIRAAARWEAMIQTPITIIVDVDYGPTRFGEPFGQNTIAATRGQILGSNTIYPAVRAALIARASNAQETSLYTALPDATVPTDIGSTAAMSAPSALLRALGFINAVADPQAEQQFGSPPSIGFNSVSGFDFDPSDGIGPNKIDFEATAIHEIGHLLGFTSNVGLKEIAPDEELRATVWDLFRFRPGVNLPAFSTAQRILSSGGNQIFFDGGGELLLSTGRPDGEGGDGNQAAHWKADELTGQYIGLMDPSIGPGDHDPLTEKDLRALDVMGYQLRSGAGLPVIAVAPTVDFGVVPLNTTVNRLLAIRNIGPAILNITGVSNPGANFGVLATTRSFAVAPGGQETVVVRFNATTAGNQTGSLSITSNDPARATVPVQLRGTVGGATLALANASAASFSGTALSSEAIVAGFGGNLATQIEGASSLPLPFSLAGTTARIRDSAGFQRDAPLFYVSPGQVNYLIPAGTENGAASVTIISGNGAVSAGSVNIVSVAPGLFSANANGQGVPAAVAFRIRANGSQSFEPISRFDSAQNRFLPAPIDLGPDGEQIFLILFGTGLRFRSNLSAVSLKIGGANSEVSFAGPQGGFAGLDQINGRIPRSLIGHGEVDLVLMVDGRTANTVRVNIK